jgi:hypothetical protein
MAVILAEPQQLHHSEHGLIGTQSLSIVLDGRPDRDIRPAAQCLERFEIGEQIRPTSTFWYNHGMPVGGRTRVPDHTEAHRLMFRKWAIKKLVSRPETQ